MQLSEKYRPQNKEEWEGSLREVNQVYHHVGLMLDGRPVFRVILLLGPRGVGKTTLAYMTANYYNLNVVELNASDERKKADILKIWKTLSTESLSNHRNLILIDEADGLSKTLQDKLVKACGSSQTPCLICANYDHKLNWELKNKSLVIKFENPSIDDMFELLLKIAKKEGKIVPRSLLRKVAAISTDYRTALNYLQMAVIGDNIDNISMDRELGSVADQIDNTIIGKPPDRYGADPRVIGLWMIENTLDFNLVADADMFLRMQSSTGEFRFWRYAYDTLSLCRNRRGPKVRFPFIVNPRKKKGNKPEGKGERANNDRPDSKPLTRKERSRSANLENWV